MRPRYQRSEVQAEAGTTGIPRTRRVASIEGFADVFGVVRRYPRSMVANPKNQLGVLRVDREFHWAAIRR